jgi:molybdopterin-guanine dinucleotide biosynthesis protein A
MSGISGAILAGGASKRFNGKIKAKIFVGGMTIISRMIGTIENIFDEIIIVTNEAEQFEEYNRLKIVGDQFLKAGPLGGIHAAIKASSEKAVFVFGCDMPFIRKDLIRRQIEYFNNEGFEVLIPRLHNYDEPLHAIYSNSVFSRLEDYLLTKNGLAIKDFLVSVKTGYMKIADSPDIVKVFTNVNSPEDVKMAEKLVKKQNIK